MSQTNPIEQLRRINGACEVFEDELRNGGSPEIEKALAKADPLDRCQLLSELMRLELFYFEEQGLTPAIDSYYLRFPNDRDQVVKAFDATENYRLDETGPGIDAGLKRSRGDRIGRFEIEDVLGSGAFAEVYLAYDLVEDFPVAIKAMKRAKNGIRNSDIDRIVQSFADEASTLAKLSHPAIAKFYEVGQDENGLPYVVMEYVKGHSLLHFMQHKLIDEKSAVEIIAKVADVLAYVHRQDVFHRDLKPANIIVGLDGHPRIVDFGLAVSEAAQYRYKGEVAGSIAYMSPEQLKGHVHRIDGRADVWSLGVMLYEAVCGRLPFKGETRRDIVDEILHRAPRPPRQMVPAVTAGIEKVCFDALQKDSEKRIGAAEDFSVRLRQENVEYSKSLDEQPERKAITLSGRAELVLASQAKIWNDQPENRRLPTLCQFLKIRTLSSSRKWSVPETKMMLAAASFQLKRVAAGMAILILAFASIMWAIDSKSDRLVDSSIDELIMPELAPGRRVDLLNQHPAKSVEKMVGEIESALEIDKTQTFEKLLTSLLRNEKLFRVLLSNNELLQRLDSRLEAVMFEADPVVPGQHRYLPGVDKAVQNDLRNAGGLLEPGFAFCANLPIETFDVVNVKLNEAGYRLVDDAVVGINGSEVVTAAWGRETSVPNSFKVSHSNHKVELFEITDECDPDYFNDFPGLRKLELKVAAVEADVSRMLQSRLKLVQRAGIFDGDSENARFLQARANHRLGKPDLALSLLNQLSEKNTEWNNRLHFLELLTQVHACLGNVDEALEILNRFEERVRQKHAKGSLNYRLKINTLESKMFSFSGRHELGIEEAEEVLRLAAGEKLSTKKSVCFIASKLFFIASNCVQIENPKLSGRYRTRAIELLGEVFDGEWSTKEIGCLQKIQADVNFAGICGDDRFKDFVKGMKGFCYTASWNLRDNNERIFIRAYDVECHRAKLENNKSEIGRPICVSSIFLEKSGQHLVSSIWAANNSDAQRLEYKTKRLSLAILALIKIRSSNNQYVDDLFEMFHHESNPSLQTELVHGLSRFDVGLEVVVDQLDRKTRKPDFLQALLNAICEYSPKKLRQSKSIVVNQLEVVQKSNQDNGVSSSLSLLKDRMNFSLQLQSRSQIGNANFSHRTISNRPKLLSVKYQGSTLLVSNTEITIGEYLLFDDSKFETSKASSSIAATGISFFEAVEYCNWLSKREGIPVGQLCYVPNEKGEFANGMKIKANAAKLRGYRLATFREWQFAAKAGVTSRWPHGDNLFWLDKYSWVQPSSDPNPVGKLLPNRFGLFDMPGNVCEWTMSLGSNSKDVSEIQIHDHTEFIRCGGSSWYSPKNAEPDRTSPLKATGGEEVSRCGFRLFRTISNEAE